MTPPIRPIDLALSLCYTFAEIERVNKSYDKGRYFINNNLPKETSLLFDWNKTLEGFEYWLGVSRGTYEPSLPSKSEIWLSMYRWNRQGGPTELDREINLEAMLRVAQGLFIRNLFAD